MVFLHVFAGGSTFGHGDCSLCPYLHYLLEEAKHPEKEQAMSTLTPQELEGRLNAHRELLIELLSAMIGGEVTITSFLRRLRDDATFKDNEEDPGVMPDGAFAIENSAAREVRSILEAARARAAADK
jgi:hypothetical protein